MYRTFNNVVAQHVNPLRAINMPGNLSFFPVIATEEYRQALQTVKPTHIDDRRPGRTIQITNPHGIGIAVN